MRALIVDDEPPARLKLRQLLSAEPDIDVVGECASGPEAVVAIRDERPDLLFLDIQMPEMDGFEVLAQVGPDAMPLTVFVTAYDEHALQAFQVNALDYLLKPVEAHRFAETMRRVRPRVRGPQPKLDALRADTHAHHLRRLVVREVGKVTLIPVADVVYVESADNYAQVHTTAASHYLRMTLRNLEQQLDPAQFLRVHRSAIVAIDRVAHLEPWSHGDYRVVLRDGRTVMASRSYQANIKRLLGGR